MNNLKTAFYTYLSPLQTLSQGHLWESTTNNYGTEGTEQNGTERKDEIVPVYNLFSIKPNGQLQNKNGNVFFDSYCIYNTFMCYYMNYHVCSAKKDGLSTNPDRARISNSYMY